MCQNHILRGSVVSNLERKQRRGKEQILWVGFNAARHTSGERSVQTGRQADRHRQNACKCHERLCTSRRGLFAGLPSARTSAPGSFLGFTLGFWWWRLRILVFDEVGAFGGRLLCLCGCGGCGVGGLVVFGSLARGSRLLVCLLWVSAGSLWLSCWLTVVCGSVIRK